VCFVSLVVKRHRKFNDYPFGYHQEIELEIVTLTNLGSGLGRIVVAPKPGSLDSEADQTVDVAPVENRESKIENSAGWVVMVPFTLPGERVRARVFRNHKNFSEADLVAVLKPSPDRVGPQCPLFGRCGGCQYQHLAYAAQLQWKQRQVAELLEHMAGVRFPVSPVVPSPREYGYRSKITPHFNPPRHSPASPATAPEEGEADSPTVSGLRNPLSDEVSSAQDGATAPAAVTRNFPIGFLRQGTRFDIVDVPRCPIATEAINERLKSVRESVQSRAATYRRGATLLLREASGVVTTDYDAVITETVGDLKLHFLARDFFQNNPFILPAFTSYVREQAAASGARFLVDAYCGSGLFALTAARAFERVAGVEISESSVKFARENATANAIANATFLAADAAAIFAGLEFPAAETAVIIDPPRKGSDEAFLRQLFAYGPKTVVYVSCDPATQMRDLRHFLTAGYEVTAAQPFDLFPQTRHLECVLTLEKRAAA
jgi:tRNA/tmRNA/rRNA uracil-C5-methylase (TrmA/RlmC/RlmD family)